MSKLTSYRQGDVLLIKTEEREDLNNEVSPVLAEGEITGHKHEIVGGSVVTHSWSTGRKFVRSSGDTVITHPEHGHIKLSKGLFEFRLQREYDELTNRYVRQRLNGYYYGQNIEIKLISSPDQKTIIKSVDGELIERKYWVDGKNKKHRSVFKSGVGFKEWMDNKLISNEKYVDCSVNTRVGVAKYKKKFINFNVTHFKKRTTSGGFAWEEVYWSNNKLMYRYRKSQKKGEFYRPDGSLWGKFEGELNWGWRWDDFIPLAWNDSKLINLYQDGPNFHRNSDSSFTWYDTKGQVRWQGQYASNQKSGTWIENYQEFVYIRGISVPKALADAKPEEIDVYRVVSEKNAQLRAVLIEKIGINRIINELKGEILDEVTINDFSLINIRLAQEDDQKFAGDKTINLLKVKCPSTQAYYTLRVPPGIKDVNTARQWTFGVDIDQEFKLREGELEFVKET